MTDTSSVLLSGAERQFLIEASNKAGRVAGHNNQMAISLTLRGLVRSAWSSIEGQSNYRITDAGIAFLRAVEDRTLMAQKLEGSQ